MYRNARGNVGVLIDGQKSMREKPKTGFPDIPPRVSVQTAGISTHISVPSIRDRPGISHGRSPQTVNADQHALQIAVGTTSVLCQSTTLQLCSNIQTVDNLYYVK
jgi:hypothetical protein